MLSIDFIRKNADKVKENITKRGTDANKANIDRLLELDAAKNELQKKADDLRARRNQLNTQLPKAEATEKETLLTEAKQIKDDIGLIETQLPKMTEEWQSIMDWVPNMALEDVPVGKGSDDNQETKVWIPGTGYLEQEKIGGADNSKAYMPKTGSNGAGEFTPQPHWEIGKKLDMLDIETSAKVSGSRFYYLKNEGYLIMYAVFDLLMKKLLQDNFMPMYVPVLVRDRALYGSSHFPGDADQVYKIESELIEDQNSLYLVGSSEPPLFAYYMDKVLEKKDLPVKMFAITPCFRSEVGSWGKDVRGMKRVHQFDKLEMDVVMENDLDKATEMHEYLLSINEWLLQQLELPYHVIAMCTGDLGYFAAAKKYDVEVWLPSQGEFMETMSDSITTDFQSRRLNMKYKKEEGEKEFTYTLNDTGATHRLLIAILEHYQQADGSVKVPAVLRDLVGKDVIVAK